jgi:Bacterial Ig-like domain
MQLPQAPALGLVINGAVGSVGAAGYGGLWLAAAGLGLAAIAASDSSNGTPAAPSIVIQPPSKPAAILSPASDSGTTGDNVTNDTTPTISGTGATAGNTITVVTPKGEVLKTTVAADGTWSVEPKVAFALGTAAVEITATDPSGNVSPVTTLNLTIVGAGAFAVGIPEGPIINLAESTSGGVPVTVSLPANAAVGDVITVSIDGSTPVSYTVKAADVAATTATILIPTADVVAAGQGAAVVTTTYKDAAGNALPNITTNLTIDTIAPSAFAASVPEGAVINLLESTSDGGVPVSVALPTNAVAGDVITVSIDGSTPVSYTVTAANVTAGTASVLIPTADVTAAGQGPAVVTTTYADAAGNAGTPATTNLTIATVAPGAIAASVPEGPVINLAESTDGGGVPVTGLRVDNMIATYRSTGGNTVTNLSGFATTYVENASAARSVVDSDVAIVEANNIQTATITLTNFQTNDLLSLSTPLPTGILLTAYDSTTGVLTLSGTASAASYQTALSNVVFSNANADPLVNPVRAISFTLTDAAGNTSASQSTTVDVIALTASSASITPVTIDLNADGQIDYSQLLMDVNGDGVADRTAWVGASDGVLVWDKNQDGQITDASQYAFSRYGGATDLSGLAAGFDSNTDGIFSRADARFSEFAVWKDANQNGLSDAGEVLTLSSLGITSIALEAHLVTQVRADGVEVLGISSATLGNGQTLLVEDAKFTYAPSSSSVLSDLDLLLAANQP